MVKFLAKNILKHRNDERIQIAGQNMLCETLFLEENLDFALLFPHSAQLYMVAESSITTKKISHLAER